MPDDLVGGRYRLGRPLGAGGMGRVWEATDTVLERAVAVKAVDLPPHLDHDDRQSLRTRVLREARAAARIDHPSSVRVFDVLEDHGRLHVVMELVEAPTLEEVVVEQGPLAPARVAGMGLGVLGALEAAHAAGIVHRDVKPANVMMLPDGGVKLADFGIASVKDDTRITAAGLVLGTPSYMSPEQAVGRPTGAPADLWGLGALLYYAVEGVAPFERGEALPTLNAVLHDPPRPMERADGLAPTVTALLVKDAEARATAPQSRVALERLALSDGVTTAMAGGSGSTAVMPAVVPAPPRPAPPRLEPAPPPRTPPPSRRPATSVPVTGGNWGWLAALGMVTLVAVIALIAALNSEGGDQQASTEAGPGSSAPEVDDAPVEPAPETSEAGASSPTTSPPTSADAGVEPPEGVPGDWVLHADDAGRYTIWYPPSWAPRGGPGSGTDFVDAATGDYLRVDFVSDPGDDPVEAWEDASDRFGDRYDDYEEIDIEATEYRGFEAARWEYTYEGQHATNLGVVTDSLGFALNFQTGEERWDDRQDVRQAFEAAFQLSG